MWWRKSVPANMLYCPPVQALHLVLLLFSVAPCIAGSYSAQCRILFRDPDGYVEHLTEEVIQLLLNATEFSNGTELAFTWSVYGFSKSESFDMYLMLDCSHLEV